MPPRRTMPLLVAIALIAALGFRASGMARAQPGGFAPSRHFELSDTVQIDRADNVVRGNLERARAYLAARRWSEAVETYRLVMENSGGMLMGVTPRRFISVREYCQLQLAAAPRGPGTLSPPRRSLGAAVVRARNRGPRSPILAERRRAGFRQPLGRPGALGPGRDGLGVGRLCRGPLVLGANHSRRPVGGRGLVGLSRQPARFGGRSRAVGVGFDPGRLDGPGPLPSWPISRICIPAARGPLGGREVNYVEALRTMLAESAAWPKPKRDPDWPTFAGSPARNRESADAADVADVAWRLPLVKSPGARHSADGVDRRAAAGRQLVPVELLPHCDRPSGAGGQRSARSWRSTCTPVSRPGAASIRRSIAIRWKTTLPLRAPRRQLGSPRYTLTAAGGKLYARMGSAVTTAAGSRGEPFHGGCLVCLDLEAQGRLLWKIAAEEGWAFEGSPLAARGRVRGHAPQRIRPQAHVACFDAAERQPALAAFRLCCRDARPRRCYYESTHNLLTLVRDTIYYNTNLAPWPPQRPPTGRSDG